MLKISNRLKMAASMVTEGNRLCDVGTDHAYVPIFLCAAGKIPAALAMDIGKGPLQRAEEHIRAYNMTEQIATRLSDGLKEFQIGEADAILIAGMGGGLIQKILDTSLDKAKSVKELILGPQSEIEELRRYLYETGFCITAEEMVEEEGKYYVFFHVIPEQDTRTYTDGEFRYGKDLMEKKHPILRKYLEFQKRVFTDLMIQLECASSTSGQARYQEVKADYDLLMSVDHGLNEETNTEVSK